MTAVHEIIERSRRLAAEFDRPAPTPRSRNFDPPPAAPKIETAAVLREVLSDRLRWQKVRYKTPIVAGQVEAYGEVLDGYPLETMPVAPYRRWVWTRSALSRGFFPLIAVFRNRNWILTPARKGMGSLLPQASSGLSAGTMPPCHPVEPADLCPRVELVPWPVKEASGGAVYLGWISRRKCLVRNEDNPVPACAVAQDGHCDWLYGQWVFNFVHGAHEVAIKTEGHRCIGGFCPAGGGYGAALRGTMRGYVVQFSTGVSCIPI